MDLNFAEILAVVGRYLLTIKVTDILDIAIMAFVLYKILELIKSTKAASLLKGLIVFLLVLWMASLLNLHGITYILSNMVQVGVLALIILFQPEIRRILEQMGSRRLIGFFIHNEAGDFCERAISQTVLACSEMSQTHTGALIVFEREILLDDMIRSGTVLDASVSGELLKNIFFVKAPMHDGAVIIRSGRVLGAGCMLPLSKNVNLSRDLGMRHRAGIGMSENSDAVVVIVSEETGSISVATGGMLKRHLKPETLENLLRNELLPQEGMEKDKQKFSPLDFLRGRKAGTMQNKISKRKMIYVGMSLLIAMGIWLFVDMDNATRSTTQINDIPVEYLGEATTLAERGLMLLDDSDQTVSLTVEGQRPIIALLDKTKVRIQADLSDITGVGTQNVSYRIIYPNPKGDPGRFSGNLTVKNVSSYMVTVNIGELYSKQVDVHCEVQGTVAEGYSAGELNLLPQTLEIRGQEEDLALVSYAKVVLKIDNADATVTQTLDYLFYDAQDNLLEGTGLHATVDQVQATLPVNVTKELRLTMKFLESPGASLQNVDYSISPATVTVTGDAAMLRDVETLVLDEFDLVSLGGNTTYNYAIVLPEGCENLSGVTRATLRIAYKDMQRATLITTRFQPENLPSGKAVDVLTKELSVMIFGTTADVTAVTGENILVTADLTDFSSAAGSYTVPATVTVEGEGNIGVTGSYQVRVSISEVQGEET